MMQLYKGNDKVGIDYRSDRTLSAFEEYIASQVAQDSHVASLPEAEKAAHKELMDSQRNDNPGCLLTGFLLVNRVPGNFHIEVLV
jgi:hypothetical protein